MKSTAATIEIATFNCSKAFRYVIKRPDAPFESHAKIYREVQPALQNSLERFKVWSRNAAIGEPGATCLEDRLKGKSYITDYILSRLHDLEERLDKVNLVLHPPKTRALFGEGDDSRAAKLELETEYPGSPAEPDVHETVFEIEQLIQCLQKMSMTIVIASTTGAAIAPSVQVRAETVELNSKILQARFPKAPWVIVERLGKAVAARAQLLQNEAQWDSTEGHRLHNQGSSNGRASSLASVRNSALERSRGKMSELGRKHITKNHPYLPEGATYGRPFTCRKCMATINIQDFEEWKLHVHKDLKSYVCTECDCAIPDRLFGSRDEWFQHELQKHRRIWKCKPHCRESFRSSATFAQHLRVDLDMPITQSEEDLIADLSFVAPDEDSSSHCILCRKIITGPTNMKEHLGSHLESIALFPLTSDDSVAQKEVAELLRSANESLSKNAQPAAVTVTIKPPTFPVNSQETKSTSELSKLLQELPDAPLSLPRLEIPATIGHVHRSPDSNGEGRAASVDVKTEGRNPGFSSGKPNEDRIAKAEHTSDSLSTSASSTSMPPPPKPAHHLLEIWWCCCTCEKVIELSLTRCSTPYCPHTRCPNCTPGYATSPVTGKRKESPTGFAPRSHAFQDEEPPRSKPRSSMNRFDPHGPGNIWYCHLCSFGPMNGRQNATCVFCMAPRRGLVRSKQRSRGSSAGSKMELFASFPEAEIR